ncbi:hypothetical protein CY35_01G014000 [Sphagnum magellanicum]|nr:hypothetical protein CY35_01G014000 [Sphagnum magellanicum]
MVLHECQPDIVISPQTCLYFNDWATGSFCHLSLCVSLWATCPGIKLQTQECRQSGMEKLNIHQILTVITNAERRSA